jgi:hypothetical protein
MKKKKPSGECEIVNLADVRRVLEAKKDREKILAGLRKPGDKIMHMGIDVNVDKAPDEYLARYILPFVSSGAEDIQGRRMTVAEFRDRCAELRALGFEVIPTCENVDDRGRCKGCPIKVGGA